MTVPVLSIPGFSYHPHSRNITGCWRYLLKCGEEENSQFERLAGKFYSKFQHSILSVPFILSKLL